MSSSSSARHRQLSPRMDVECGARVSCRDARERAVLPWSDRHPGAAPFRCREDDEEIAGGLFVEAVRVEKSQVETVALISRSAVMAADPSVEWAATRS